MVEKRENGSTAAVPEMSVYIKIWPSTKKLLDARKKFHRMTYDDIITELLDKTDPKKKKWYYAVQEER
jgi:hypothetical protein